MHSCHDWVSGIRGSESRRMSVRAVPHGVSVLRGSEMRAHSSPPWRQPRGKLMVSSVNSCANATRIGWHLWEIQLRFTPGLPPGWLVAHLRMRVRRRARRVLPVHDPLHPARLLRRRQFLDRAHSSDALCVRVLRRHLAWSLPSAWLGTLLTEIETCSRGWGGG